MRRGTPLPGWGGAAGGGGVGEESSALDKPKICSFPTHQENSLQ